MDHLYKQPSIFKASIGIFPFLLLSLSISIPAFSQQMVQGRVLDKLTKEPIANVSITALAKINASGATTGTSGVTINASGATTCAAGSFAIRIATGDALFISCVNYQPQIIHPSGTTIIIVLAPQDNKLQELIVTGNRMSQRRTEAPIAISAIGAQRIAETKANQLDQLLNKVSGVFMVDLGNEQHEMSIRQPMSTQSLFLYLEDGIPIRTTGVYNHNALLEMNMTAARQIEIIRGPASSLYGAEAIGGAVNVITQAPPAVTNGYLSVQGNNNGYKRFDARGGTTVGKWGFSAAGYYANRTDGPIQYSDFHKTAITLRADYQLNEKTTCAKERVKVTMRASDAMVTHGTRTQERASTRLAVCQKGRQYEKLRKKDRKGIC